MTDYVCGFLFNRERTRVLLIEKQKPAWQRGLFNGIGGKIEPGETIHEGMVREFQEETGTVVPEWTPVAELYGSDWTVYFMRAFDSLAMANARTTTDESVGSYFVGSIDNLPIIPNLKFLVPLALDTSGIVLPVRLRDRS